MTWPCTCENRAEPSLVGSRKMHGSTIIDGRVRRARKAQDASSLGFTLIELLVALVLLALMFVLLTSGLRFGTKIWTEKDGELSEASQVLLVENLLRRLLSEAQPVFDQPNKKTPLQVKFFGTKDSVRFVAPMLDQLGVGGFYEVTIKFSRATRNRVEMFWRMFRQAGKEQRTILLQGDVSLEFSFFGSRLSFRVN